MLSIFYDFYQNSDINLNYVMCLIKLDQVKVNTVLGSSAPPLTVKLVRAFISGSKDSSVIKSLVSNDFFYLFDFLGLILCPTICLFILLVGCPIFLTWLNALCHL